MADGTETLPAPAPDYFKSEPHAWDWSKWKGQLPDVSSASYGVNIAMNAAPVIAVAAAALYVYGKIRENINWNADLREYRQEVTTRHQRINAVLIVGGVILSAIMALKVLETAIGALTFATVIGGVWLGVGSAILLNHWVYQRYATHDGSLVR